MHQQLQILKYEINNIMLLKEFIYFDKKNIDFQEDGRYLPDDDLTIFNFTDLRKTPRLTLKVINDIRKSEESRDSEIKENLGLIRKMYAVPPPEQSQI